MSGLTRESFLIAAFSFTGMQPMSRAHGSKATCAGKADLLTPDMDEGRSKGQARHGDGVKQWAMGRGRKESKSCESKKDKKAPGRRLKK